MFLEYLTDLKIQYLAYYFNEFSNIWFEILSFIIIRPDVYIKIKLKKRSIRVIQSLKNQTKNSFSEQVHIAESRSNIIIRNCIKGSRHAYYFLLISVFRSQWDLGQALIITDSWKKNRKQSQKSCTFCYVICAHVCTTADRRFDSMEMSKRIRAMLKYINLETISALSVAKYLQYHIFYMI